MTTNGIPLASPQVRTNLLANFEQITISIDGLAALHDRVRGQDRLVRTAADLRELATDEDTCGRLLLRVNTVLMRDNIETFDEFCTEMADWGFHELTFNQLGGNERPEFFAAQSPASRAGRAIRRGAAAIAASMAQRGPGHSRQRAAISTGLRPRQLAGGLRIARLPASDANSSSSTRRAASVPCSFSSADLRYSACRDAIRRAVLQSCPTVSARSAGEPACPPATIVMPRTCSINSMDVSHEPGSD